MDCPDSADLALWLEGRLPRDEADAIRAHLDGCLSCRLVAGPDARERSFDADAAVEMGNDVIPPGLLARMRGAFHEVSDDVPLPAEPVLLAADSSNDAARKAINPAVGDGGKLVVTFRSDPTTDVVTAHFVSQDATRRAHRPILVGDRIFLSDAEGKAALTGLQWEDLLGMRVTVPPVLGVAMLDPATLDSPVALLGGGTSRQVLRDETGAETSLSLSIRHLPAIVDSEFRITLGVMSVSKVGLVVVFDDMDARFMSAASGLVAVIPWKGVLPHLMRITAVDLS